MRFTCLSLVFAAFSLTSCNRYTPVEQKALKQELPNTEVVGDFLTMIAVRMSERGTHSVAEFYHSDSLAEFRLAFEPRIAKMLETVEARVFLWRIPQDNAKREALTDEKFFSLTMQCIFERMPQEQEDLPEDYRVVVVGLVPEGDLIHAVVRDPVQYYEQRIEMVRVFTLKMEDDTLKLVVQADLMAAAEVVIQTE